MADVPVQLVAAAFDDEGRADEALKELKAAKRERLVGIESAAGATDGDGAAGVTIAAERAGDISGGEGQG